MKIKLFSKCQFWGLVYVAFIAFVLLLWTEKVDTTRFLAVGTASLLVSMLFLDNNITRRICLIGLLILINPLLSALIFPIESKVFKVLVLLGLLCWWILTDLYKLKQLATIIIICNIIFVCLLITNYYSKTWDYHYTKGLPPIAKYITKADTERDIYIIIMDQFPANAIIRKYAETDSRFQKFLINQHFQQYPSLSKYYYTDKSLPNIFSGLEFENDTRFSTKHMAEMQKLVPGSYITNFTEKHDFLLKINSLLVEPANNQLKRDFGKGGDISLIAFTIFNRVFDRIHLITSDNNNKEIEQLFDRNYRDIAKSFNSDKKQFGIYHFLTFHSEIFDKSFSESLRIDLAAADKVGIRAVGMILKQKPNAKIIVFSDHGERDKSMLKSEYTKGILYIKN